MVHEPLFIYKPLRKALAPFSDGKMKKLLITLVLLLGTIQTAGAVESVACVRADYIDDSNVVFYRMAIFGGVQSLQATPEQAAQLRAAQDKENMILAVYKPYNVWFKETKIVGMLLPQKGEGPKKTFGADRRLPSDQCKALFPAYADQMTY